jgi:formylglycine-generating enzyme required for sulfatase activity
VGHYAANPWGLFDTTGNVWSWTADCHANSHVANPKTGAPASSADCSSRVVRGGSWGSSPQFLRSADRDRDDPANRDSDLGFRLARTLSPLLPDPITFPRP